MDISAMNTRKSYHIRSNSLPSKPHPIIDQVDEHLCRLKASEATTSSTSLCQKLGGLQDLHDSIDKLLLLPLTQQALFQGSDNDLLEGSIRLLDVCDIAKDVLLQTKERARELASVLRRRGGEMIIASDVQNYLNSRKAMKKTIYKALKGIEMNNSKKSDESSATVSLLKEVEAVTYSSVVTLLSFIAGPKSASKSSRWSLVTKLVSKKVACKYEDTNVNEVEMVDAAIYSIASYRTNKSDFLVEVENLQSSLRKFESSIQDLEEDLESLYRSLIKNRVSFLNILNH